MSTLPELLTEVADVLAEQNWRGDLVEALRDAAQLAAPASLLRRLLDDHQRMEPHHADLCQLCKDAQAAIAGAPAPTDRQIVDTLARHGIGWGDGQGVTAYPLDGEDAPVYIAAVRELMGQPAQGERICQLCGVKESEKCGRVVCGAFYTTPATRQPEPGPYCRCKNCDGAWDRTVPDACICGNYRNRA